MLVPGFDSASNGTPANVIRLSVPAAPPEPSVDVQDLTVAADGTCDEIHSLTTRIVRGQYELSQLAVGSLLKALEIGHYLIRVRQLLPHGSYLQWIEETLTPQCGIKRRTAQRYTRLAKNRDSLLRRLQIRECAKGNATPEQAISEMLSGLRIEDGVKLLNRSDETEPPQMCHSDLTLTAMSDFVPPSVVESARQYIANTNTGETSLGFPLVALPIADGHSETCPIPFCVVYAGQHNTNPQTVNALLSALREGSIQSAFLWLSSHGLNRWLPLLNAYPRVCCFSPGAKRARQTTSWWLFGILPTSHFALFCSVTASLGDALIPFDSSDVGSSSVLIPAESMS